jgi:hypothetical protein
MKLEMYDVRAALSEMFVNILPPLKEAAEYMMDTHTADKIMVLCERLDPLLARLHRILPREVEVPEGTVEKMLGLEEDEMETSFEKLIKDIQETDDAINGKKTESGPRCVFNSKDKAWHRNGRQLKLIVGGKEEEGPFKDKGV